MNVQWESIPYSSPVTTMTVTKLKSKMKVLSLSDTTRVQSSREFIRWIFINRRQLLSYWKHITHSRRMFVLESGSLSHWMTWQTTSCPVPFTQCMSSENAVVSPENVQVWVRLQNTVVRLVNNRTVCECNHIKDSNTGLTTIFCCCVNVAIKCSPWCRSKPVRPPFIVRTHITMFLFESESCSHVQKRSKEIGKIIHVTSGVQL